MKANAAIAALIDALIVCDSSATDEEITRALELISPECFPELGRACFYAMVRVHIAQLQARRAGLVASLRKPSTIP